MSQSFPSRLLHTRQNAFVGGDVFIKEYRDGNGKGPLKPALDNLL